VAWNGTRYPAKYSIYLGDGVGTVNIKCDTYINNPCRFVIYHDNAIVEDSGWFAGDSTTMAYTMPLYSAACAISPGINIGWTGTIEAVPGGSKTISFVKPEYPYSASVWVYAQHGKYPNSNPLLPTVYIGNKWSFTASCPV